MNNYDEVLVISVISPSKDCGFELPPPQYDIIIIIITWFI